MSAKGAAAAMALLLSMIEEPALTQMALDIARLTGEPVEPLLRAAEAPAGSILQNTLKARVDRYLNVASAAAGHRVNWSTARVWLAFHGVPE